MTDVPDHHPLVATAPMVHAPEGSIIERMAETFYAEITRTMERARPWSKLDPVERQRFVAAMVKTVNDVPDSCDLTATECTTTFRLGEGRQAMLAEHKQKYLLPPKVFDNKIRIKGTYMEQ